MHHADYVQTILLSVFLYLCAVSPYFMAMITIHLIGQAMTHKKLGGFSPRVNHAD
jgi:hypothetical protein